MRRKIVIASVVVVVALVVLVALAPTIASPWVGGAIARAAAASVSGRVTVEDVSLGWFSPFRIGVLRLEGEDGDVVDLAIEVEEGLLALATGEQVTAVVSGRVVSRVGEDGRPTVLGLAVPPSPGEKGAAAATGAKASGGAPAAGSPLAGRSVRLAWKDLSIALDGGARGMVALPGVAGSIDLADSKGGAAGLDIEVACRAPVEVTEAGRVRRGALDVSSSLSIPMGEDGSPAVRRIEGTMSLKADSLPLPPTELFRGTAVPSSDGAASSEGGGGAIAGAALDGAIDLLDAEFEWRDESLVAKVRGAFRARAEDQVEAQVEAQVKAPANGQADAQGAASAPISIDLATGPLARPGAEAWFEPAAFDLAALRADVDIRSFPVEVLAPVIAAFVPRERFDPVADLGSSIDLRVVKGDGDRAEVRFAADAGTVEAVARLVDGGAAITDGAVSGAWRVRPERMAAAGIAIDGPMAITLDARALAWSAADGVGDPFARAAGTAEVRLSRPIALPALLERFIPAEPIAADGAESVSAATPASKDAVVREARIALAKDAGRPIVVELAVAGGFAGEGTLALAADARVATDGFRVSDGGFDARIGVDGALLSEGSRGALAVKGAPAVLRVRATDVVIDPMSDAGILAGLRGSFESELAGALAVDAGSGEAMLSQFAARLAMPTDAARGSLEAGFLLDGAETRIEQRFAGIPGDWDGLAAAAPEGTIRVRGIDPAMIARLAPAGAGAIGILGRGAMTLEATTVTTDGQVEARFTLDASAVDARGTVRGSPARIGLEDFEATLALDAEATASIEFGDGVVLEPGASAAISIATLALVSRDGGWWPDGELAARVSASRVRVLEAPGLAAALPYAAIDAEVGYAPDSERAVAKGRVVLGASGGAGTVDLDLAWRKPVEAKVFGGLEGTVALESLDLARLAPAFGVEAATATGWLGARGGATVELIERTTPEARVVLRCPQLTGDLQLSVTESQAGRSADANGVLALELPAAQLDRLAGFERPSAGVTVSRAGNGAADARPRFVAGTSVGLTLERLRVPLGEALAPDLAALSCLARATVGGLEIGGLAPGDPGPGAPQGAASRVGERPAGARAAIPAARSVGLAPLELRIATDRLSEVVTIAGGTVVPTTPASEPGARDAAASSGTIAIDGRVAGLLASSKSSGREAAAPGSAVGGGGGVEVGGASSGPRVDLSIDAKSCAAAAVDVLAGTGGAIGSWLGATLDLTLRARDLSSNGGELSATLRSPYASVDAPALGISDGALRVGIKPVVARLAMSPAVKEELLATINPVFADISTAEPARFTLDGLSWPLDGDRRRFDASFRLETGDVALTNSGPLGFLLGALGAQRTTGFEARLEPLVATVERGRLRYRDFTLRAGRTQQGAWRQSLVFSGDIDLVALRANAITTAIPLSDAASWSSEARSVVATIEAASPELLRSLTVGLTLSGPLFDAEGRPAKLEQRLALPDLADVIR
ncbi:MAG: hypothetical protein RI967_2261, partial [Planctomycetota bacterium]